MANMDDITAKLLKFAHVAENLKREIRHSFLSDGRPESVAEHVWRATLIAVLMRPYLGDLANVDHVIEMLVIHDLVEIFAGDVPAFANEEAKLKKKSAEQEAMRQISELLPTEVGDRIRRLWGEFETCESSEAAVANAIDKLEAQLQHNEADIDTWLPEEHDRVFTFLLDFSSGGVLSELIRVVREEAVQKLEQAGINVAQVMARAAARRSKSPDME